MSAPPTFPAACVVDASVLIKLFVQEQDSDVATALFTVPPTGQLLRAVPDLVYLECANIFRTRVHRGLLTIAEAGARVTQLAALPLAWYATPPLLTDITSYALTWQIRAYDAAYPGLFMGHHEQRLFWDRRLPAGRHGPARCRRSRGSVPLVNNPGYVTLADALHMPLITADTVLLGKLSAAGISVLDLASFR